MGYAMTIELNEELYQPLLQLAAVAHQTPEEWMVANLQRLLGVRDDKLRRHFGSINLGSATDVSNERIDADLARESIATHE
jgi:hypothetical protein